MFWKSLDPSIYWSGFSILLSILCFPTGALGEDWFLAFPKWSRCLLQSDMTRKLFSCTEVFNGLDRWTFSAQFRDKEQITTIKLANSLSFQHYLTLLPRVIVFTQDRLSLVQDNVIWHLNRMVVGNESYLRSYWVSAHIILGSFCFRSVLWDITWQKICYTDISGLRFFVKP